MRNLSPRRRAWSTAIAIERIALQWNALAIKLKPFTSARVGLVEISEAELSELLVQLRGVEGGDALARTVNNWRHEPVRARLERLAGHARALSVSLGKGPVIVQIEADETRIAPESLTQFWGALVHVVRNAVDHGLESPEERVAVGKPIEAEISLRASMRASELVIEVEDDGRGIDWLSVAHSARQALLIPSCAPSSRTG